MSKLYIIFWGFPAYASVTWVSLLIILSLSGCQQMQGTRLPSKPSRNHNDPFLSSPTSRIPPTRLPSNSVGAPILQTSGCHDDYSSGSDWFVPETGQKISQERGLSPGSGSKDNSHRAIIGDRCWEEALRRLRSRGVLWQKLEMREGQWRFECSAPDPTRPGHLREYQAEAADPLSAVLAVVEKIQKTDQ